MPKVVRLLVALAFALSGLHGCGGRDAPLVAFLGDSLTDGWGLSRDEAYPALLARELAVRGQRIRVLNAGRGGDTAAQGRARLDGVLHPHPDVLVVALGINDALRGLDVDETERDLGGIVMAARAQGVHVVLVGVDAPPSLVTAHTKRFAAMYRRLAERTDVDFVPDLLAGAAGKPESMFPDALHPNAAGQRQLAANVLPAVERALARITGGVRPRSATRVRPVPGAPRIRSIGVERPAWPERDRRIQALGTIAKAACGATPPVGHCSSTKPPERKTRARVSRLGIVGRIEYKRADAIN